jgi:cellulose synthase/poly-beta-1,6-N-acetylglucosamine synthase-like glycosyltransferase
MSDNIKYFHPPIDESLWHSSREWRITICCVFGTLIFGGFTLVDQLPILIEECAQGGWSDGIGHAFYLFLTAILIYGGVVYQLTRAFYIRRTSKTFKQLKQPLGATSRNSIDLTVLVPSFKEEYNTIYQTLMSAVFQEFVTKRLVLLIDNPPNPSDPEELKLLQLARGIPDEIRELLNPMADYIQTQEQHISRLSSADDKSRLIAETFEACGNWFADQAAQTLNTEQDSHTNRFFAMEVLLSRAYTCWEYAVKWEEGEKEVGPMASAWDLMHSWFETEISSFERKTFENCTHAANKASNLNGYLSLMGNRWSVTSMNNGERHLHLEGSCDGHQVVEEFDVPDSPFVITLDADSLLLPYYAKRLTDDLNRPDFERVGVIQTPYSSIPGADGLLERVASATTDVQYIIHQGFTTWNATYWVGANALMRKEALEDIACSFEERGFKMKRYVQDRTVIEDTESTIDLLQSKWTLWNHPARLAYSATPPDFGSLLIQRRRWANGGLLILPKALSYLREKSGFIQRLKEGFLRLHYLVSITGVNIGLLLLLAFPMTDSVSSFWLPLTALPYFYLYGRDLRLMRYARNDVFRVYALNLLLIPVNIGGVLKSLQQALTRKKIPFSRTPKVTNRTPVLPSYILATLLIIVQWIFGAYWDFNNGYPSQGLFAAVNALILGYAVFIFIGAKDTVKDLFRFND